MPRVSTRPVGGSLAFNGSTSLVTVTGSSAFNLANTFTLSCMFKARVSNTTARFISKNFVGTGGFSMGHAPTGKLLFTTHGVVDFNDTSNFKIQNGVWYHITVTFNSSNQATFYINGVKLSTIAGSAANLVTSDLTLGGRTASEFFNGYISKARFQNVVLTDAQVTSLFNSDVATNVIGQWNLDEMTGSTALDTSGNANNGTIVSGTWSTDRPFANRNSVQGIKASQTGGGLSPVGSIDIVTSGGGTMMGWVKPSSQIGNGVFGFFDSTGTLDCMRFNLSSTYPFIWTTNTAAAGTAIFNSTTRIPNGVWTHVACTLTTDGINTTGKIYINGQLVVSSTLVRDVRSCSRFYAYPTAENKLTKVLAYERELSQTEILSNYNSGAIPTSPNIIWEINEGAGNILYDRSGNGSNGTTGTLTWSSDTPSKARKQVGGNMIPNGDFSYVPVVNVGRTSGGSGFLDGTSTGSATNALFGWSCYNNVAASIMFDTATLSPLGSYSLKASLTGAGAYTEIFTPTNVNGLAGYFAKTKIPVKPNTSYTLSFYMKTNYVSGDSNDGAGLALIGSTGDGTTSSSNSNSVKIKTTTDWTLRTLTWTTSATTRFAQINPLIYGHTGAGTLVMDAWFANITLVPTSQLTASAQSRLPSSRLVVGGNLVPNGDFSYVPTSTTPTTSSGVWITNTAGGSATQEEYKFAITNSGTVSALFDTATKYSGNASLKVSTGAITSWAEVYPFLGESASNILSRAIPAKPSTSYTYSFRMKTNLVSGTSSDGAFIAFREFDGTGTAVTTTLSTKVVTTTDWTYYTGTFTTASNTRYIYPRISLYGHTGTGTLIMDAWFDDVTITPTINTVRTQVS